MKDRIHSEDLQDVIGKTPHILVHWGITWVFLILMSIVLISAYIRYPDILQSTVRINTMDAPKVVPIKISGYLNKILIKEGDYVSEGQPLAWIGSTADHATVTSLLDSLYLLRDRLNSELEMIQPPFKYVISPSNLGEIQLSYQTFYQYYLNYEASINDGVYQIRKQYILKDIDFVKGQRNQIEAQQELQKQEYKIATEEFERYNRLAEKKVISTAEFQQQEAIFLSKQHPLKQSESALIANDINILIKQRELTDLENQIQEERSKFIQATHSLISEIEQWKLQYILTAPQSGNIIFAGSIQNNQYLEGGSSVFYINPGSIDYFGEVSIPQYNMGKVSEGQRVLIKLHSYPFEQYGAINGTIQQLNHIPIRDSVFLSKVQLDIDQLDSRIQLRAGLVGKAEIITEEASLLGRLYYNIIKLLK